MDCTIIILGATGDLSRRKLIPAVYNLIHSKKLEKCAVIGVALSAKQKILADAKKHIKNIDMKIWKKVQNSFYYYQSDFYDKKKVCRLGKFVRDIEKKHKLPGQRLFYLATLPEHFNVIAKTLSDCNLSSKSKVVFEKPFGHDLKSAKEINKCIKSTFSEKQIFGVDHYLGKELVQDISVARFTNTVLEPLWNKNFVDHVQIILSEDIDIEGRGTFYDKYGTVKDVVQNHMMQMLALTAMEAPKKLVGDYIRDEKVKILKKTSVKQVVLGQYDGFTKEKGVAKNSKTETFAALRLEINNKRWKGVPFYLITGKNLKKKETAIHVQFKNAKCLMFKNVCDFNPNYLRIQIQPDAGIKLQLNSKKPGSMVIVPVKMDFCHSCTFGADTPEAYENLMLEVLKGDQSVFVRSDEIEQQWKIVDKIKKKKVEKYKKGKIPVQAEKMINWSL